MQAKVIRRYLEPALALAFVVAGTPAASEEAGAVFKKCLAKASIATELSSCIGLLTSACRAEREIRGEDVRDGECESSEAYAWGFLSEQVGGAQSEIVPLLMSYRDALCGLASAQAQDADRLVAVAVCERDITAQYAILLVGILDPDGAGLD